MIEQIIRDTLSHGWSTIPHLLDSSTLMSINAFIDQHQGEFVPAKVGKGTNQARREEIRGDHTFWIDPKGPPKPFEAPLHFLSELKNALNRELYLGMKEFECHLAYYPAGTFYKTHLDKFEQNSTRVFSFVFYLNQEWKDEMGGELVIYDGSHRELTRISPDPGTFICFLSEEFPHEVKPATRERRSLTGWMHTKIIF